MLGKALVRFRSSRWAWLEPWYNWGGTFIERMDVDGEGPGRFFAVEWLGVSFTLFFGRTPAKKIASEPPLSAYFCAGARGLPIG